MAYKGRAAQPPRFGGPDPLRRLPASQSHGDLRRQGSGSLPPALARNSQSKPRNSNERPLKVPPLNMRSKSPEASEPVEVLRIGAWSVCRTGDANARPIFVHVVTGTVQDEPPEEVLRELAAEEHKVQKQDEADLEGNCDLESQCSSQSPSFRRILLGRHHDMPLKMARDILLALRDDPSMFDVVQSRFSDNAAEPALEPGVSLPEELMEAAAGLACHEISEVIGTESGMQILLRVA